MRPQPMVGATLVDATLVDNLVRSGWPRASARTAARGAQNNRARAETILKMPGFVKEEDMRPFVAELVDMGFGPAEAMVLDALKMAKGNKLTALATLREQQPQVVDRAIGEAVDALMEMGFGPRLVVVEALRRHHGNKQHAVFDLLEENAVDLNYAAAQENAGRGAGDATGELAPAGERKVAQLVLDGYAREDAEEALARTHGNVRHARNWLASTRSASAGREEVAGPSPSNDAASDSSGEIGPLTLERIPRGEAVTIRGDPTGQKYTRDALAKYITDARNPVIPTTGQKMSTMPATRQKTHESDAAWIGRILVPAPDN